MKNLLLLTAAIAVTWLAVIFWDAPAELFFRDKNTRVESLPTADSYMRNTFTTKYDEDGSRAYLLSAQTGLYFSEDDRFELQSPKLTARKSPIGTEPWQLVAATASSTGAGEQVVLSGDVHAWQEVRGGTNEFFTPEITYTPATNSAQTALAVRLSHPEGETTGVGMHADFTLELYRILSNVEGRYNVR